MMSNWAHTSREEAFKRAAGRRKYHISLRKARAERIKELLSDMLGGETEWIAAMFRAGAYGATRHVAQGFGVSEATASRDLALCHLLLEQFKELFEREFSFLLSDEVTWAWDYSHYGFKVDSLTRLGVTSEDSKKTVGRFPFRTRPCQASFLSRERAVLS
jgi:hypothetical protein